MTNRSGAQRAQEILVGVYFVVLTVSILLGIRTTVSDTDAIGSGMLLILLFWTCFFTIVVVSTTTIGVQAVRSRSGRPTDGIAILIASVIVVSAFGSLYLELETTSNVAILTGVIAFVVGPLGLAARIFSERFYLTRKGNAR